MHSLKMARHHAAALAGVALLALAPLALAQQATLPQGTQGAPGNSANTPAPAAVAGGGLVTGRGAAGAAPGNSGQALAGAVNRGAAGIGVVIAAGTGTGTGTATGTR